MSDMKNNTEFADESWGKATEWRDACSLAGLGYICDDDLATLLRQILPRTRLEELAAMVPNASFSRGAEAAGRSESAASDSWKTGD